MFDCNTLGTTDLQSITGYHQKDSESWNANFLFPKLLNDFKGQQVCYKYFPY